MARELSYRITGDARDFNRTLKSVDDHLGRSEKRARRFGQVVKGAIGVGAVTTMGVFAKAAVTAASDVNESLTKNQQLFGRHAAGIEKWSKTTAENLAVSRREALAAAGTFGGLFSALKIGEGPAARMSRRLVTLAADLASFNNASPEEALTALRSGLAGEAEPMRRFNAFLTEGRVKAEAYRSGIAKQGSELTEQQKVQARYNLILKDTVKAHGDARRTMGGTANQARQLAARYDDLKTELGEKLLPVVNRGLKSLNRFIDQMKSGKGAGGEFAHTLKDVAEAAKDITGFLKDHPRLVGTAVAAWATYRAATALALAKIRFRKAFMRSVPAAAESGAAAGTAYSTAFDAAAGRGIRGAAKGGKFRTALLGFSRTLGIVGAGVLFGSILEELGNKGKKLSTGGRSKNLSDIIDDTTGRALGKLYEPNAFRFNPNEGGLTNADIRRGGRRRGRREQGSRSRGGAKFIAARMDTIDFQLQMERISNQTAISQYESLLRMHGLTKQVRRDILLKIKGLHDDIDAAAKDAEEEARREAEEARQRFRERQRRMRERQKRFRDEQRRASADHKRALAEAKRRGRSADDGSGDFELNVGDVRVPTVYEVRRGHTPIAVGADSGTTINGGVHISFPDVKDSREAAEAVAAYFNRVAKTHGAAVKRAQAKAKGRR